jgi:hypothetical protein
MKNYRINRNYNYFIMSIVITGLIIIMAWGCNHNISMEVIPETIHVTAKEMKTELSTTPDGISQVFSVTVREPGRYFMSAWVRAESGARYALAVNGTPIPGCVLQCNETGWQSAIVVNEENIYAAIPLELQAGTVKVSFSHALDTPMIEEIIVSGTKEDLGFPQKEEMLQEYKTLLATSIIPAEKERDKPGEDDEILSRSTPPASTYKHVDGAQIYYTYRAYKYFNAGTVTLETVSDGSPNPDTVLHLFSTDMTYSWGNDDGGAGLFSKLTVTIPSSGVYIILVRGYGSNVNGRCHLNINGSLYASNIVVSGYRFYIGSPPDTYVDTYNYFTTKHGEYNCDTFMFILSSTTTVIAYNDDYYETGDFDWGLYSRINRSLSSPYFIILSSYGSSSQGYADIYAYCENPREIPDINPTRPYVEYDVYDVFTNLDKDDAIESASETTEYNCIGWSGGETTEWRWPPSESSQWHDNNPLYAFDNYYGNRKRKVFLGIYVYYDSLPRFSGAMSFYRTSSAGESSLDLFVLDDEITHASVSNNANYYPHGYAWESKMASLERIFHPRYSGDGGTWGDVTYYYRDGSSKLSGRGVTFQEALETGEIVKEHYTMKQESAGKLTLACHSIDAQTKDEFQKLYRAWEETWKDPALALQSNPHFYARSSEYKRFLAFMQENGKAVWPLFFDCVKNAQTWQRLILENVLQSEVYPEYISRMDEVHAENKAKQDAHRGPWIQMAQGDNVLKFCEKLIDTLY